MNKYQKVLNQATKLSMKDDILFSDKTFGWYRRELKQMFKEENSNKIELIRSNNNFARG